MAPQSVKPAKRLNSTVKPSSKRIKEDSVRQAPSKCQLNAEQVCVLYYVF